MRASREVSSPEYRRIAALSQRELETLMVRGETPDMDALAGWEYRGYNPKSVVALIGIRKFIKGFYTGDDGSLMGYNIAVKQSKIDRPWQVRPSEKKPFRHGFYSVEKVDPTSRDNAYLHALLLDYGKGPNPAFDPTRPIRDYIVRVHPGSDDLLLGKAYVALGPLRTPVGYFLLERYRTSTYRR